MESQLGILPQECPREATRNLAVGLVIVLMLSAAFGWSGLIGASNEATAAPTDQGAHPFVMRPYGDARLVSG